MLRFLFKNGQNGQREPLTILTMNAFSYYAHCAVYYRAMESIPQPANDNTPEGIRRVDTQVFLERYQEEGRALLQQLEAQQEVLAHLGLTEGAISNLARILRFDLDRIAEIPEGAVHEALLILNELHDDVGTARFVLFGEVLREDSELAYINKKVKEAFLYKEAQEKQAREQALTAESKKSPLFFELRALAQEGVTVESVMQQAITRVAEMQRAHEEGRFRSGTHNIVAYMTDSLLTRLQKQVSEVASTWQTLMRLSKAPVKGIKEERAQLCRAEYQIGRELAMRAETLVEYYNGEHQYAHNLQEELARTFGPASQQNEG